MTTTCYECHHVETPTRMFTAGRRYPVLGQEGHCDIVSDDFGRLRYLLPSKVDGSAGFIVHNDWPTAVPRYALFRPAPPQGDAP